MQFCVVEVGEWWDAMGCGGGCYGGVGYNELGWVVS